MLLTGVVLLVLPLTGVALTGRPIAFYLEVPSLTQYVTKPAFSWPLFFIWVFIDMILFGAILILILQANRSENRPYKRRNNRFPIWGWIGVAIVCFGWFLAWTRMDWF
jgi:hypothetical protein